MDRLDLANFLLVFVPLVWGCSADDSRPPSASDCTGPFCGTGQSTGSTPGVGGDAAVEAGSNDADAAKVAELSGKVIKFINQDFSESLPFEGWGYVRVPTLLGHEQVGFGGDAGTGFSATGVVVGNGWFTVVPDASFLDAGAVGSVLLTYAFLAVPPGGSTAFEVPVVPRNTLSRIYAGLNPPTTLQADAAQVVVVFERGGQRLWGVSITDHPTAEALAFSIGVGYATSAQETGNNGVALLVNVTGIGDVSWRTGDGITGTTPLVYVQGQASLVKVEVLD